jgi:hypothetical protein
MQKKDQKGSLPLILLRQSKKRKAIEKRSVYLFLPRPELGLGKKKLAIIIFFVAIFSKTYMHRKSGLNRFHNHFLLFYIGVNLLIIAGKFETFFLKGYKKVIYIFF